MYGMYPWDGEGAAETDAPARSESNSELAAALQFALDRRDNGGDAARHRPQPVLPDWEDAAGILTTLVPS
jgi:hypothetical protein